MLKSPNRSCRFWGLNQKTVATSFETKTGETVATGFDVKLGEIVLVILRTNHWQTVPVVLSLNYWQTVDLDFEAQPINSCSSSSVYGADHTRCHSTSWSLGHRVTNMCLTIHIPLHQVSYSYYDPHHCPPCCSCHMHTRRQANTFLHTK
jgi:hypothetical protein